MVWQSPFPDLFLLSLLTCNCRDFFVLLGMAEQVSTAWHQATGFWQVTVFCSHCSGTFGLVEVSLNIFVLFRSLIYLFFQLSPGIRASIPLLWTSVTSCGHLQCGHICLSSTVFYNFFQLVFFAEDSCNSLVPYLWRTMEITVCKWPLPPNYHWWPRNYACTPAECAVIPAMLQTACGFKGREVKVPWSEAPSFLLF